MAVTIQDVLIKIFNNLDKARVVIRGWYTPFGLELDIDDIKYSINLRHSYGEITIYKKSKYFGIYFKLTTITSDIAGTANAGSVLRNINSAGTKLLLDTIDKKRENRLEYDVKEIEDKLFREIK